MGEFEIDLTVLACSMLLKSVMQKIRTSKPISMGITRVEGRVGGVGGGLFTIQASSDGVE